MQQADRADGRLLGDVEAGSATLVALHAARAVEHEHERNPRRIARHPARQGRYPLKRGFVVPTRAEAILTPEQQQAAAVLGHGLLDQLLLQCGKIDGRHIHQDDGRIGEPILEIEGRTLRLDNLGLDVLHRQSLGEYLRPSRLRRDDQDLRCRSHVDNNSIAIVLRECVTGCVDRYLVASSARGRGRDDGLDPAASAGELERSLDDDVAVLEHPSHRLGGTVAVHNRLKRKGIAGIDPLRRGDLLHQNLAGGKPAHRQDVYLDAALDKTRQNPSRIAARLIAIKSDHNPPGPIGRQHGGGDRQGIFEISCGRSN